MWQFYNHCIGVKVIETKKTDAKKTEENSCEASTTTQLSDTQVLQNASYDSNESTYEEENNEKWACPWKAQHENVEITTFHNPHDFYIAQKSELYVFLIANLYCEFFLIFFSI